MSKKKIVGIIGLLALFGCVGAAMLGQLGGGGTNSGTTSETAAQVNSGPTSEITKATKVPAATRTPKPQPTAAPVPQIGEAVDTGEVLWIVLEARDLGQTLKSDNQFVDPKKTEGRFILVSYKIENQGDDKRYYQTPELVDAQGREFSDYDDAIFFLEDDVTCVLQELGPNLPKTCTEIYEVAANATGLRARVTGALLDKAIEVDLGLK